uniref:Protein FAR1-RELATED SEQUENCE n=1 Tax=Chenopodium quinoa TaxID=63459 RepID=A0A803N0B9_CHEQI
MATLQRSMLQLDEDILQTGRRMEELQAVVNAARMDGQHRREQAKQSEAEQSSETVNGPPHGIQESYKTPKKGFSSVAISVEIEKYVEVEVGLPPPSIGMVFQSWQELDEYFRVYGKQNGFGVVRTSACKVGKWANAKMRRNCLWTCECFGLPNRKRRKVEDKLVTDAQIVEDEAVGVKRSKKVQCLVNVYANVNERGEWVVQRAHMKHVGHTPTPEKAKNITLEVRAISEKRADENNSRFFRQPMTAFPAESVFCKIYTDAKFKEVQRECSRLLYVTGLEKRQLSDTMIEHVLEDIVWFKPKNSRKEVPSQRKRVYKVIYNRSTKEADCECRCFHCHGIMFCHMIMVYQINDCTKIPDKYILRCWRKDFIRKHTRVKVKYHDPSKTEAVCRFDKIMVKFSPICSKASICKSASDVVLNGLQLLDIQIEEKLSMLTRNRSDLMGCNGTPSFMCLEKDATPPTTEKQGSCAKDLSLQLATIKDSPIPKKPPHRTIDLRYKTCVEKSKKSGRKKQATAAAVGSLNNPQSSFPQGFPMQMDGYMSPNTAVSQFPY